MSKATILKYFTEFTAWCNDQEVYVMFNNGGHRLVDSIKDFNEDVKYIILKDSYFPYRKALVEGKTIQCKQTIQFVKDWVDVDYVDTMYGERMYRIKPDEPQFKVGDWIINTKTVASCGQKQSGPLLVKQDWIDHIEKYGVTYGGNTSYTGDLSNFKLWTPQPNEWVCSVKDTNSFEVYKYKHYINPRSCQPFIGALPEGITCN